MAHFWRAGHVLAIGTNMAACSSFCCLFLSIVTDSWLCTKERAMISNGSFVYVTIYSGLWRRCTLDPRSFLPTTFNCSYIGYFTHVERDGIGPTDSILLSLRKATGFPMVGLVMMLVAQTVCFVSHCSLYRQCLTITFGVMFVSGGLLTLVGIIIYIGAITEEAGNKMKSKDEFPFQYFYGPSLVMAIFSFIASQMTGVIAVNLFLSRKRQRARRAKPTPSASQSIIAPAAVVAATTTAGDLKLSIADAFEDDCRIDDDEFIGTAAEQQKQLHLNHQQQQQYLYLLQHQQQQQQKQQQQQRPQLTTSNSVDYHPKRDFFVHQESTESTCRSRAVPDHPARRLVRNYSEETNSWRLHGSDSCSPDKSMDNIYLSVHRLQHRYPKSSSHGRLAQVMMMMSQHRQPSASSRSPPDAPAVDDGGSAVVQRWQNSNNRLHQTNHLPRSRLRINNSTADWPTPTLASANQRKVIGSSIALGIETRRDRTYSGGRKPDMIRQWSEMTPEEGRLLDQSKERLRLSNEELNYSHRRITPV